MNPWVLNEEEKKAVKPNDGWDSAARFVRITAGVGIAMNGLLHFDLTRMGVGLLLIWSVTL